MDIVGWVVFFFCFVLQFGQFGVFYDGFVFVEKFIFGVGVLDDFGVDQVVFGYVVDGEQCGVGFGSGGDFGRG